MKTKRNDYIKNIRLTLMALISTALLGANAMAADTTGDTATQVAAPNQPAPNNGTKEEVVTDTLTEPQKSKHSTIFATVGNMPISWIDYDYAYATESKQKFYHAKPTEANLAVFQREIGDTLINNAMLVLEAKRRKIKPDAEFVKQQLDQLEQRFSQNPNWPDSRPRVLPILTERIQNENLRSKLEALVRKVPNPSVKQLRKYYDAHPEKFTSPQQQRVSTILLRMDPAAPDSDWQKANEQAQDLVKRLRAGEDFSALAHDYSGDATAEDGGDMGYLHEGMLPGLPESIVAKLQPGETSDPVTLMEGVAIFRLTERKPAQLSSFKSVQQRAQDLWLDEQSNVAWNSLIAKLKKNTPVQKDESHFFPLPAANKPATNPEISKP